jgi:phenylacetate-CoA ligase
VEKRVYDSSVETLGRDDLLSLQWRKLSVLIERAWAENPFYRQHWEKAGVSPQSIASLNDFTMRIPTVEKRDFMTDQEAFPPFGLRHKHVLDEKLPLVVANTSGTSGQGIEIHAQTESEFKETGRIYGFLLKWAGLERGDRVFLTVPITLMAGGRCEFQGAVEYGLTTLPVGNYDVQRKLELMARYRPRALLGTTSYFGHLAAESAIDSRSYGVDVLLTGGEGSGLAWLKRLEEAFGARVYDRYGSTQSGNDHMFTCEHGIGTFERPSMLHNIDPMYLTEVVDPATGHPVKDGEPGEIVITSLYHIDTPLIRCRTRDRGIYREWRSCSCGRPFSGIEVASISRIDDMKKVKGVNIWPQAIDDVMFADKLVDEYQVRLQSDQRQSDTATLIVMPKKIYSAEETETWRTALSEAIQRKVGIRFAVEILKPGALSHSEYKARRWIDERTHAQRD